MSTSPGEAAQAKSRRGLQLPVWLVVALGGLLVAGGAFVAVVVSRHRDRVRFGGRFVGGHVGHPILWLFVIGIVIALIVVAVIALVRHYSIEPGQSAVPTAPSRAEELLAERFARGEIDEEEFRRRRDALRG
jgi:putative membrane protein